MTDRSRPENPSRRAAMRRLGMAVVAAYVVPEVVLLSEARASGVSPPSVGSYLTPPTPPSPPEEVTPRAGGVEEIDESPTDACRVTNSPPDTNSVTISESDFKRAQASVEAGYAKPFEAIWADFTKQYSGRVIAVAFTGFKYRPTYRLKAISPSGRLETVLVSARTGEIIRIIGC